MKTLNKLLDFGDDHPIIFLFGLSSCLLFLYYFVFTFIIPFVHQEVFNIFKIV